jgi:hypothetical protein
MGLTSFPEPDVVTPTRTAFGEQATAQPTPLVQVQFPYNINSRLVETRANGGTVTQDTGRVKVSTGALANRTAMVLTRDALHYAPGQGGLVRFTTVYATGASNSTQLHGVGDAGDGYFFGYNGTAFGILRRTGGRSEIRTLTVSTASIHDEDITITLDGDSATDVTVTDTGGDTAANKTTTANEIAAHDFSNLGTGWRTFVDDNTVIFISYDTSTHTGTYELADSQSSAGTFAQTVASAAVTDTWVAQSSWSDDKMDGTGASGMTLDPTKGNVYQIQYQWLGFGQIRFFIEHDTDGEFELVHTIDYANANTAPSILIPTLPLHMMARNAANTSDLVMFSSSMAGFIEGKETTIWPVRHSFSAEDTDVDSNSEQPIASIRNDIVYQGRENRTRIWVRFIEVGASAGNKPVRVRIDINSTLTGSAFAVVDADDSVVSRDSTATVLTGGEDQFTFTLNSGDRQFIDLSSEEFIIGPGTVFTVSAQQTVGGTNSTVDVSINWVELF